MAKNPNRDTRRFVYLFDSKGGFIALDRKRQVYMYAFPKSFHARRAEFGHRAANRIARQMLGTYDHPSVGFYPHPSPGYLHYEQMFRDWTTANVS